MFYDYKIPINSTAKKVVGKGVHYEPEIKEHEYHSDVPSLKLRNTDDLKKVKTFKDYTGLVFGRLKVIGLCDSNDFKKTNVTRWLVRCSCGQYEVRTTAFCKKRLTNPAQDDWCRRCNDLERLKTKGSLNE